MRAMRKPQEDGLMKVYERFMKEHGAAEDAWPMSAPICT